MDTAWYYQRELEQLRTLAVEFSKTHPAVAPLLAGPSSDPDVERLLEGTAYLTGQLSQKLDESYDRIAENLSAIVLPQLLRDIPSCTIMCFTPKGTLKAPLVIPKGTRIGSVEKDGVSCIFSTTAAVELAPMKLEDVETDAKPGTPAKMHLHFALHAPDATSGLTRLRLYMKGTHASSALRLYSLLFYTTSITLKAGETTLRLPASALKSAGFAPNEGLFPYPENAWKGYRMLQEFFVFTEKFFFLDILLPEGGLASGTAKNLSCTFEFTPQLPETFPAFSLDDFALFATPAANLFPFETVPLKADFKRESYLIRANTAHENAYVPYQVLKVSAITNSGREQEYKPMLSAGFDHLESSYTIHCPKRFDGKREMRLFPLYPPTGPLPEPTVLSLNVLYSNGDLAASLGSGEVNLPLSTSPALATFVNLTPPTRPVPASADGDTLWAMLAHLHLNYLPLANATTLKALLTTYLPTKVDAFYANANKRRIESIASLVSEERDFLWKGRPVRGTDITVALDESGFSNRGDMCLFGLVLAKFLHKYSTINSFMRVTVTDTFNQKIFQWQKHQPSPTRL